MAKKNRNRWPLRVVRRRAMRGVSAFLRKNHGFVSRAGNPTEIWSFVQRLHPEFAGTTWRKGCERFLSKHVPASPMLTAPGRVIPRQRKSPPVRGSVACPGDVVSDAFLWTYEWRQLRMKVLKKYGPRCQCCGASASDGTKICVDHIKPRRKHPELALDFDNLQVLCDDCNHGKGSWDMTDWRHDRKPTALRLAASRGQSV